jgi:pteridine reductase
MTDSGTHPIDGKVALITGAARRIGASVAETLHAAGMRVAIHYRSSKADAEGLRDRLLSKRAESAQIFQADLVATGAPANLIEEVVAWSGSLDVLVNNASTFYPTPLAQVDEASWTDLMGSNLKVPLFLTQAAAPHLYLTRGSIINIVDIHGHRPLKDHPVYSAAKAGLAMLTRALAKDLAPHIRVNGVSPGAIAWPENGMTDDVKQDILSEIPLGRSGVPADIANAILFLVRDATYSTGQIIAIDGGRSTGWQD